MTSSEYRCLSQSRHSWLPSASSERRPHRSAASSRNRRASRPHPPPWPMTSEPSPQLGERARCLSLLRVPPRRRPPSPAHRVQYGVADGDREAPDDRGRQLLLYWTIDQDLLPRSDELEIVLVAGDVRKPVDEERLLAQEGDDPAARGSHSNGDD